MRRLTVRVLFGLMISGLFSSAGATGDDVMKPEPNAKAYDALYEEDPTLPDHVVYRPASLGSLPEKLPVYLFGNGGCSKDGTSSKNHLLEIAAHGYLVIAPGIVPESHPGVLEALKPKPGAKLSAQTLPEALTRALDWAIQENSRPQSAYFNRIDVSNIAVSGWSCGGLQAIIVASDPRIKTIIVMNSGVFNGGQNPIEGINVNKAMLNNLHGSALYVLGGPTDIAYPNGTDDFSRLNAIPAALVNIPVGHGGTYGQPHGGIAAEVVVNWLDWKLKATHKAGRMFLGNNCGYCHDARLTLETKGMVP